MLPKVSADLLYKDEAYAIVGAAMEVYNQLGPGFAEAIYQEALAMELRERNIPFVEQHPIQVLYKGKPLRQRYIPDFFVYDKIIVEIKAIKQLGLLEQGQILNYLKATGVRLGLLINFGNDCKLDWERKVL
jgi:GxxExxY protein